MRKIKVWGGTHPDEEAALACVDSLQADPLPHIACGIANPLARLLGRRWVDVKMGVSPITLGSLAQLGIKNLVSVSFPGLQRYVPNVLILEALKSGLGSDIEKLRNAFAELANSRNPTTAEASDFKWFRHLDSLHVDRVIPSSLDEGLRRSLNGFDQLPDSVAARMGVGGMPAHLMSWRYAANKEGYWGELVTPIATPDATLWPGQNY